MQELWQLYDEQGRAIGGKGATKDEVFSKGILHGASHVWIWRSDAKGGEILLQKRAAAKRTWPNRYDISAAGHIDLGESPMIAAIRETQEEIGVTVKETDLKLISVQRIYMEAENGAIENEFQWLYLLELPYGTVLNIQEAEVGALEWKALQSFRDETQANTGQYVPHTKLYFATVVAAVEKVLATKLS